MATDLFWNESERVLFWSVTDASGDLCQRLGDSTRPDADSARRMYEMNVRKGPPFDQVYRADSEPQAPDVAGARARALAGWAADLSVRKSPGVQG